MDQSEEDLRQEKAWRTFSCGSAVTWDLGWLRRWKPLDSVVPYSLLFLWSAWLTDSQMLTHGADQEPVSPIPEEEQGFWSGQKRNLRSRSLWFGAASKRRGSVVSLLRHSQPELGSNKAIEEGGGQAVSCNSSRQL